MTAPTPSTPAAATAIRGPLRMGSRSADVRVLQLALNEQPTTVPVLGADGIFGMRTSQAVQRFQSARSLGVDGIVGPNTARALGLAYTPAPAYTPPAPVAPGGGGAGGAGGGGAAGGGAGAGGGAVPGPGPGGPSAIQTELAALMDAVARGIGNVGASVIGLVESIDEMPDVVINEVRSVVNGICSQAASAIRSAASFVGMTIPDLVGTVFARIRERLGTFISRIASFLGRFTGLPFVGDAIASIISIVRQTVEAVLSTILSWMQGGATAVAGTIQRVLNQLSAGAQRILSLA